MDDTRDFGTPKKDTLKQVTLTIDGQKVTVAEGTSVMRAAAEFGSSIPSCVPQIHLSHLVHVDCVWLKSKEKEDIQLHAQPLLKRAWLFQHKLQN